MTLDHLSGGRALLGVGLGDLNDHGWSTFGEPSDDRERPAWWTRASPSSRDCAQGVVRRAARVDRICAYRLPEDDDWADMTAGTLSET